MLQSSRKYSYTTPWRVIVYTAVDEAGEGGGVSKGKTFNGEL